MILVRAFHWNREQNYLHYEFTFVRPTSCLDTPKYAPGQRKNFAFITTGRRDVDTVKGDGNDNQVEDTSSKEPWPACAAKGVSNFPDLGDSAVNYISTRRPVHNRYERHYEAYSDLKAIKIFMKFTARFGRLSVQCSNARYFAACAITAISVSSIKYLKKHTKRIAAKKMRISLRPQTHSKLRMHLLFYHQKISAFRPHRVYLPSVRFSQTFHFI